MIRASIMCAALGSCLAVATIVTGNWEMLVAEITATVIAWTLLVLEVRS